MSTLTQSLPIRKVTFPKGVITLIALFTAISPYLADFNDSHVYNQYWPGHARFHNGQTMTLGLLSGLTALYFLWIRTASTALENLRMACLFSAFYWMSMLPAILYPGATFSDPLLGGRQTDYLFGFAFTQIHMDLIIFLVLIVCYRTEAKRLQSISGITQ